MTEIRQGHDATVSVLCFHTFSSEKLLLPSRKVYQKLSWHKANTSLLVTGCLWPWSRVVSVLQGWKLFAEAHNLQAGDQISFELIGERRLVVKCIQAAGGEKPYFAVRSQPERPSPTESQPSKSPRLHTSSSPSRQQMSQVSDLRLNFSFLHEACPFIENGRLRWTQDGWSVHTTYLDR